MKRQSICTDELKGDRLSNYLLNQLRIFLALEEKYSDEIIEYNLPYLFAREEHAAINWVYLIENQFNIHIPNDEIDSYFFSSVVEMAKAIRKYKGLSKA